MLILSLCSDSLPYIMPRSVSSATSTINLKYIIFVLLRPLMWLRYVSFNQQKTITPHECLHQQLLRSMLPYLHLNRIWLQQCNQRYPKRNTTFPITTNTIAHSVNIDISEPTIHIEQDNIATIDVIEPQQKEETTTNCVQSIPISQDQHPVFFPCFQIGASEHKGQGNTKTLFFKTPYAPGSLGRDLN